MSSNTGVRIVAATAVLFFSSYVASRHGLPVGFAVAVVGFGVGYRRVLFGMLAAVATASASAYAPGAVSGVVLVVAAVVLLLGFAVKFPDQASSDAPLP